MTTDNHTPYPSGTNLTASDLNSPLGELDAAILGISPLTTKGDVFTYTTVNARLAVGTNGYNLQADSAQSEGIKWAPGPSYFAIIRDEKTTTTTGGASSAATWNIRDLNTELSDTRSIVSIASNKFTPIAGTFLIEATAPGAAVGLHRLKLWNDTGSSDVFFGQCMDAKVSSGATSRVQLIGTFTADGLDAYEIQHYTTSVYVDGLGIATSDGAVEVYCVVKLTLISV